MRETDWKRSNVIVEEHDRTNNEVMPVEINERRTMMNAITKRNIKVIGHLLRRNRFIAIIIRK